jgi:hypothetical protein
MKHISEVKELRKEISDTVFKEISKISWTPLHINIEDIDGSTVLKDFDSSRFMGHVLGVRENHYKKYVDVFEEDFLRITNGKYARNVLTGGKEMIRSAKTPSDLFDKVKVLFEGKKIISDAKTALKDIYRKIYEDGRSPYSEVEMVIPALHILYKEQLEQFHEIIRSIDPTDFTWERLEHPWLFMNIISYGQSVGIDQTDVIKPSLLLLNLTTKQIVALNYIVEFRTEDPMFLAGAFDEIFFNYQLDQDSETLRDLAMQKGMSMMGSLRRYLSDTEDLNFSHEVKRGFEDDLKV